MELTAEVAQKLIDQTLAKLGDSPTLRNWQLYPIACWECMKPLRCSPALKPPDITPVYYLMQY